MIGHSFEHAMSNKRSFGVMSTMSTNTNTTSATRKSNNSSHFICQWQVHGLPCSEAFSDPELLFAHTSQHIHIENKQFPFTCQWGECNKKNHRKDHLLSHIRVHIPYRPYKCKVCGKGFKRSNDTREHERIHKKKGETQRGIGRISFQRSSFMDTSEDPFNGDSSTSSNSASPITLSRTDHEHSFPVHSGLPSYQNISSLPSSVISQQPENSFPNAIHSMNNSTFPSSQSAMNPNYPSAPPYMQSHISLRAQSYSQLFSTGFPPPSHPLTYYQRHEHRYPYHYQPKFQSHSYDMNSYAVPNEISTSSLLSPAFSYESSSSSSLSLPFNLSQPQIHSQSFSYSQSAATIPTPSSIFLSKPPPQNNFEQDDTSQERYF